MLTTLLVTIVILLPFFVATKQDKGVESLSSEIETTVSSWYQDALQEMAEKCPLTEDAIISDLVLMQQVITPQFDVPVSHHPQYTQGQMFFIEDASTSPAFSWVFERLGRKDVSKVIHTLLLEIQERYMDSIMEAKEHFGKPRPKIASQELQVPFVIHDMPSAQSPALPSGHAIQALLFGAMVVRDHPGMMTWEQLKNTARLCLEVGWRRVVGGVHYPADVRGAIIFVKHATREWGIDDVNRLVKLYEHEFKRMFSM